MFSYLWKKYSFPSSLLNSRLLVTYLLLSFVSVNVFAQIQPLEQGKKYSAAADLRYGVALFHYYEGDYMAALSELLVAEAKGGIKNHGDNAKIMEGGFSLAYGMEKHASDIFETLLENNRSQHVKDSAWYYLGKIRYRHNDWDRAQGAIEKISEAPITWLKEEIDALRVNIMIRQDRLEDAGRFMTDNPLNSEWQPYINYNMGSAWSRRNSFDNAIRYYNLLASEYFTSHEHRGLFDKAMTAAGYLYLFEEEYQLAMTRFSKVRLNSALSNRALLGLGWAATELENYQEALRPWKYLADSSLIDESTQEALLAVPFAYERLNANVLALENYQRAEKRYMLEIDKLDDVILNLQGEALLETLEIEKSEGIDWIDYAQKKQLSPRVAYLAELFSRDEFQDTVQDIRDLLAIKDRLTSWQNKLSFYDDMLVERKLNHAEKVTYLQQSNIDEKVAQLSALRSQNAQRIQAQTLAENFYAFIDEEQQGLYERVQRIEKNVALLKNSNDPFIDEYEESLRRFKGIQLWQLSEDFAERSWNEQKKIQALDQSLNELNKNYQNALNAMTGTPDIDQNTLRIAGVSNRISQQQAAIDKKIAAQQIELSEQLIAVLGLQRARLFDYMAQSRLAIARIYDKANEGEER